MYNLSSVYDNCLLLILTYNLSIQSMKITTNIMSIYTLCLNFISVYKIIIICKYM